MATTTRNTNPLASFYEAQTAATSEIVQAALTGMQTVQRITLQAMRAGADGQVSLAQSMASMRDGGDASRISSAAAPVAEQGARYQRDLLKAIGEMNSNIVRASYSMMEKMRDALGAATQGSLTMSPGLPDFTMGSDALRNPTALYDSTMQQWQTAVQQMMQTPAATMPRMSMQEYQPARTVRAAPAGKSKRSSKRMSPARKK